MVQRSPELRLYPNLWNGISGFLDDNKSIVEKVREELREECGIQAKNIKSIKLGEIHHQQDKLHTKTWIVHPVLVEVLSDMVKLNWESQDYCWATRAQIKRLDCLSGFAPVLKAVLKPRVTLFEK